MQRTRIPTLMIGFLAICLASCQGVAREDPVLPKTGEIISGYKAVFTAPPTHVPSSKIVDSPITGNGDIGLTVSGRPDMQRYWISKNDFWKSGPDFQQCGPSLIGGVDVGISDLADASYHIEQMLYEPVISSKFSSKKNTVFMDARVMAGDNVVVWELRTDKESVTVDLRLWVKDGYGSETAEGRDGDLFWVSRKFKTDDLMFPTEATLALRYKDKPGLRRQYKGKIDGDPFDDIAGQPMFCGMKSHAVFASMNMILRYHYTYDQDYIRKVYPYLIAVADFWEDYLKFERNRYVIPDDCVYEVGPWNGNQWREGYGDINPITSLGFLKVFFKAMIEISRDIQADIDRQDKWEHILANLIEFPVHEANGRTRFRACEGGHGRGLNKIGVDWVMLHGLVFPAPNIGLNSKAKDLAMIRNDLEGIDEKTWLYHGNAFQTLFIGAARVGYDPDVLLSMARKKIRNTGGGSVVVCHKIGRSHHPCP